MEFPTPLSFSWTLALIVLALLARFFQRLHFHRSQFKGLPGPPHSYLFGHLIVMGKVLAKQPRRAAPQTFVITLKEDYNLGDYWYIDSWPFGPLLMFVTNIDMVNEFTVKTTTPKHPQVAEFMYNFGGPGNLVGSNGAEWKKWRSVFNPGFSSSHLMTLVPAIIGECKTFCKLMDEKARTNEIFRMEQAATRLTIDIICKLVLDIDLDSQRGGPNELVDAFNSQVKWQAVGAQFQPSELIDFRRPFVQAYNNWKMNRFLGKRLDERFATRASRGKTKHVIDLALEAYQKEFMGKNTAQSTKLDPVFRKGAISNVRTFVFAGHDTTSSTICYAYHYLNKNPDMLAEIRREHDDVFGTDPGAVEQRLLDDPHLLNKLEYTLAVIKEVLRVQPPASTVRSAAPALTLRDPQTNEPVVTENFMLWAVNVGIHRNPEYFPDPHTFQPARFLPEDYYPGKINEHARMNNRDAWLPFSKGNRNCIGQELAYIETKIILAMTVRRFDFAAAYDELSLLRNDGSGYLCEEGGIQTQFGEEAYQVQLGTAKPREGMPCRLRRR